MSPLEEMFGKSAQLSVLEYLIKKRGEITYLSGIAEGAGFSHSSVAKVIEPLLSKNIVIEKRIGKQMRIFTLNEDNETTKLILKFYDDLTKIQ